jgi:hypothetical protein
MKQTLLTIKRTTKITTKAIAQYAQLPIADVFTVETGGHCPRETVQKVIDAFNQLSGKHISVNDIHFLQPLPKPVIQHHRL